MELTEQQEVQEIINAAIQECGVGAMDVNPLHFDDNDAGWYDFLDQHKVLIQNYATKIEQILYDACYDDIREEMGG